MAGLLVSQLDQWDHISIMQLTPDFSITFQGLTKVLILPKTGNASMNAIFRHEIKLGKYNKGNEWVIQWQWWISSCQSWTMNNKIQKEISKFVTPISYFELSI